MNKAVKTFALSAMSVALLSGCVLDDKYDDSSTGGGSGGNTIGNIVKLYGDNSNQDFALATVDKNGNMTIVADSGDSDSLNIRTIPFGDWSAGDEGSVLVTVSQDEPASIMTTSSDTIDLTTPATEGTVQFFIRPLAKTQEGKRVFVTVESSQEIYAPKVDITSAFNAFVGAENSQQVKVPLSCFSDIDFSASTTPFRLETESSVHFELGNTRLRANTINEAYVLSCDTGGEVVNEPVADVFSRNRDTSDDNWETSGAVPANSVVNWGNPSKDDDGNLPIPSKYLPSGNSEYGPNGGGVGVRFDNGSGFAGQNGGLRFNSPEAPHDLSLYMESGTLNFDINIMNEPANHSGSIDIKFETSVGVSTSRTVTIENLPIATGEFTPVSIPVSSLFTANDGRIDAEPLKHAVRFVIQPTPVKGDEELAGMDFRVNNVNFIMNP